MSCYNPFQGLTVYKTDQARLLGDAHSRETVKEKMKTTRQRMDAEKMQHALGFFFFFHADSFKWNERNET